jgi:thiamine kinase-like enzyme
VAHTLPDLAAADAALDCIEVLRGVGRRLTPLSGGHVNRAFRVDSSAGQYVARFAGPKNSLLWIDAATEAANTEVAARGGVGPQVREFLPQERVLLVDWVEGRPLRSADLANQDVLTRVAQLCRRLHSGARFVGDFDLMTTRRRYLDLVEEHGFRLPDDYREHEPQAARIEAVLAATAPPTVPCHNDLVAANVIDDSSRLWFIDYEYSANADPSYELGNLASDADLDAELIGHLAAEYLGERSPAFAARVRLYAVLCHYTWTLWAAIQHAVVDSDIDFWQWGLQRYARARTGFAAPELTELLATASAR